MTVTQIDRLESRFLRRLELLRGWWLQRRGVAAGIRLGLGSGVRILYPGCLTVGDDVTIEGPSYLHCLSERGVRIGAHTSIARNLWLHCGGTELDHAHGFFVIGDYSFVGPNAVMGCGGGIIIGHHVLFGPNVTVSSENHVLDDPATTIDEQGVTRRGVIIEDDCWIASQVVVLDGVTIGQGAVVAAGAVVASDVPPYTVVAGVPARVVRRRGKPMGESSD
jgi:acetyltransferase-like isoleucine patch superfamily enzyme